MEKRDRKRVKDKSKPFTSYNQKILMTTSICGDKKFEKEFRDFFKETGLNKSEFFYLEIKKMLGKDYDDFLKEVLTKSFKNNFWDTLRFYLNQKGNNFGDKQRIFKSIIEINKERIDNENKSK